MRIGIEAQRLFRPHKHGMDRVVLELILNLQVIDKENEYFIFVKPDEDKFTGFVFKIHANMDPKHRDRLAFIKIVSGEFKRNTPYLHVRLSKKLKFSSPNAFFADKKEIVDISYPGDIVGLHDTGNFKIGDTLTSGENLVYEGIPSFSPEHFRYINNADPMKSKQLSKGINQLMDEGVAQLFTLDLNGRKVIGTVGALQYEVIQYRLEHEYGAKCSYENLNVFKACWVECKNKKGDDALTVTISSQGKSKDITLIGSKGKASEPKVVKIGKLDFTLVYGSKAYTLPFNIKLNDFIGKKYPGTEKSFSSYESKVTVQEAPKNFDAHIYMNHILDHKGYRFFQASFDADEKGTVLSVNHDFWGTLITYIGYFMLFFAMLAILFTKHSRFADLKRKLEVVKSKKAKLISILLLSFSLNGFTQNHTNTSIKINYIDSILKYKVPELQAEKFGRLIIQDDGGRMKPINTFSSELLRKVSKKDSYNGMNSDQVFISIKQFPFAWIEVPLIYIKNGNDSIRKIIGAASEDKYVAFKKFFDAKGNYKLSPYLDEAYKSANPNNFEKDFYLIKDKAMTAYLIAMNFN